MFCYEKRYLEMYSQVEFRKNPKLTEYESVVESVTASGLNIRSDIQK